jgi:hypothetical protein
MDPQDPKWETLLQQMVPAFGRLEADDQARLRAMAADLYARSLPAAFVSSSLRSTAEVLQEMRECTDRPENLFRREDVQRFIEQNAVSADATPANNGRRERKREERERLYTYTVGLLREARQARGRHEVKKTRNMLLKLDQREVRRVLGREGDELCRQINLWLRDTAALF